MGILRPLGPAPRHERDWAVADFEWRPSTYELTCLGAFDEGGYRPYRDLPSFMRGEVGRRKHIWWHAGGLADATFVIDYLIRNRVPFEVVPIHSAAVFLKVMGSTFHDSYFLLRAPLRDLSTGGESKGEIDYETADFDSLCAYNEQDNRVLWAALHRFADIVSDLGGYPRSTVAATALDLFRRSYQTTEAYCPEPVKELVRHSYFASDVQVNRREGRGVHVHDIASSFPRSMLEPLPWRYLGRSKRLRGNQLGIGLVTIHMPRSEPYPNIPVRARNGGVYFPTGEIHGWYCEPDIARATELGARVQVHEWLAFSPCQDLAGFVRALAPLRLQAKKKGDAFWALALKILLNSLYGKWGERPEKEKIVYGEVPEGGEPYLPGIWKVPEIKALAHEQPQVCAWTVSLSRIRLHRQYRDLELAGHPCYNWDTDSVFTTLDSVPSHDPAILETDDGDTVALGGWGREGWFPGKVKFLAPKMYAGVYEDKKGARFRVKAKGVAAFGAIEREQRLTPSERERLLQENWAALVAGKEVRHPAMRRFRKIMGGKGPGADILPKSYRGRFSKRCFLPDGSSRPWDIDELPEK